MITFHIFINYFLKKKILDSITMISLILKFLISFSVFLAIDLLWLGIVARNLYVHHMGHLLRTPPN